MIYLLIPLAAFFLRAYLIFRDSVPFAYDMGRDLLWTKDIAFYKIPTLIGPASSIWGVYFGPLWYYFLSVPLRISGGNPLSAVFATALGIVIAGILAFVLFKNYVSKTAALVFSIIVLFSSLSINISTFAFPANLLPLLSVLVVYSSFIAVYKNPLYLGLSAFFVSLMFHSEPPAALVFSFTIPSVFLFFKLYKSRKFLKTILLSGLFYLIPFAPYFLFEIRNGFVQTNALIAYFGGQNPSLSGYLPLVKRFPDRVFVYLEFLESVIAGGNKFFAVLIIVTMAIFVIRILIKEKDPKIITLIKLNLLILLVTFFAFVIFIPSEIKNWYIYALLIPLAMITALVAANLRKFSTFLPLIFLFIFLVLNIFPFFSGMRIAESKNDPAQLNNQLKALDLIYKDSPASEFSVYVFTPSVYDHNYQYLFWWQGIRNRKGLPSDFAYLPETPDYVRNKNLYVQGKEEARTTYLIIENGTENEFYTKNNWLKNFSSLDLVWEKEINRAIVVQKRQKD